MPCTGSDHHHINFVSKGKLLLIDVEKAKREEFNRRRKMRLQQVRHQSNEIAREIREKVKAEKHLKTSKEELKKQAHFNRWKDAQMKTLQDQFNRNAAIAEHDKENALKEDELAQLEKERQQVLEDIAKKRGNLAVLKQRKEKLDAETENFLKSSNAKFNRSVENLRSALVSSLPKPDSAKTCPELMTPRDRQAAGDSLTKDSAPVVPSEDVQDFGSVMRVIGGENVRPLYGNLKADSGLGSSSCTSPKKVRYRPFESQTSPKKQDFGKGRAWSIPSVGAIQHQQSTSSTRESRSARPVIKSHSSCQLSPRKGMEMKTEGSPSKRVAPNELMSPSKRVSRQTVCNHAMDTSPTRCEESYSPNRFRDELEGSVQGSSNPRARHVRFENVPSPEDSLYRSRGRNRSVSECDSEVSYESDLTWPPRNWNHHQAEEVILYDHCARSTSRYQPRHTVTPISHEPDDDGLEKELEACRERAIRRHEESLRERRGCRAMYRQRLRAEFSCMISDLAKLDKKTRLAKLESEAKAALIPKKQVRRPVTKTDAYQDNKMEVDKDDTPGNVRVMECIDPMDMDPCDKKTNVEVSRQELVDCNLDALDQLLNRLKKQRDHLLNLHSNLEEAEKDDAIVQCPVQDSSGIDPDMKDSNPNRNKFGGNVSKSSRATSPINMDPVITTAEVHHEVEVSPSPQKVKSPSSFASVPLSSTPKKEKGNQGGISSESSKSKKVLIPKDKASSSYKSLESSLNDSKQVSPIKVSDGSSANASTDKSAYSFEGVKVEVKVTKNKARKLENCVQIKTYSIKKSKDPTTLPPATNECSNNQSWAKKLSDSSSGGTSYMSPPNELNPDEHKLLISILEGYERRNKNPALGIYIQKLLSMSKTSLENMSISVSDDSIQSDTFRSCNKSGYEVKEPESHTSFASAQSDQFTQIICEPVKKIFESDEGSSSNNKILSGSVSDNKITSDQKLPQKPSAGAVDKSRYVNVLKQCNDRLNQLAESLTFKEPSFIKSGNDTSYLDVPSSIHDSVRIAESVGEMGLPRPESSLSDNRDDSCKLNVAPQPPNSWGVSLNIHPKPETATSATSRFPERRPKPPSTINNYTSRGMIRGDMLELEHELSTIVEVDSKLMATIQPSRQYSSSLEQIHSGIKSITPIEGKSEESFHTLPSAGAVIPSDTSYSSSAHVSPVKPADESSLQIFSELPDSSFGQSSNEEVAVPEVFKSVGMGWAVSTWRRNEASKKKEESSSSSDSIVKKKISEDLLCRHSTPIKPSSSKQCLKYFDDSDKLTSPDFNLYERYQKLLKSVSDSSTES